MSRTLTRPMFRKGGMAQREKYMGGGIKTIRPKYMGGGMTGIMSGIRPDAGLTPRVGYANGPSLQEIIAGKELQQPGKTIFTEDYIKNEYDKYLDKIYKGDISDVDIAYGMQVLPPVTTKDAAILEFAKTQPDTSYGAFKKGQLPGSKIDYASKQAKQKKEATEAGIDLGLGDASDDNELNDVDTLNATDTVETTKDKFRRIFDEYLPVIEEQLKPDEDAARRDRYLALARFGAGLAAQPGGDLVGAIGKAAEKPISDLSKISAQQRREKQTPKMLALQAALSQMDNKGKTATEIGIDAQRVDSIAKDISGRSELTYETAYGVAEKLDKLRREGSSLAGKFTSQYPKDPKKVAKIKEAKYFYTTDGDLKVVENGLTYSISEWEQELKKRKKTKKA